MKRTWIVLSALLCLSVSFAYSADFAVKDIPATSQYIDIVGVEFLGNVAITMDYGSGKAGISKDGQIFSFKGMVDALNYFYQNGWEFVNAYAVSSSSGGGLTYHYLLKRRATK